MSALIATGLAEVVLAVCSLTVLTLMTRSAVLWTNARMGSVALRARPGRSPRQASRRATSNVWPNERQI
jgi:hypothetical protein